MRREALATPWAAARVRPARGLGLVVLAVLVLGISGGLLWTLGINYEGLSGSAAHKIHPATYLTVALLGLAMLRAGNPVAYLARVGAARPASVFICAAGIALLLHIMLRKGAGMAGSLDTFLLPGLLAMLLVDADETTFRRLETVVHAVMTANALLGLVEFATGQRFFPFRVDGVAFETDTRSAALQGHPLGNATLTACYLAALMAGGGTLPPLSRLAMIGLQFAALITFGGRSALVVSVLVVGGRGLVLLHRMLLRGRVPLLAAAAMALALPLVPIAIAGLAHAGFFDALLDRFREDGGSAHSRVEMFTLFAALPLRDLIFGPDTSLVDSLRRINGLEWGIENPIVRTLLYQGILMTALLVAAVALYLREVARHCRAGTALPILVFAALVNTFESLGSKTTLLAKFAILLLVLFHPFHPEGRRRP